MFASTHHEEGQNTSKRPALVQQTSNSYLKLWKRIYSSTKGGGSARLDRPRQLYMRQKTYLFLSFVKWNPELYENW